MATKSNNEKQELIETAADSLAEAGYVSEAVAMLGVGYEHPTVTVEAPRRTIQRRGRKMVEVETPAFVKFSTEFKTELADLDVYALKVFIYIGLSINFETQTAWPGVRKIAKETKMDKDTVTKAVEELENKGFLTVSRREGGSNEYKPTLYFAIGDGVPCGRTVDEPSDEDAKLSLEDAKLSLDGRVNLHNKKNKTQQESPTLSKEQKTEIIQEANQKVDAYLLLANAPGLKNEARLDAVLSYLAVKFRVNTETPRWKKFAKFVVTRQQSYNENVETFVQWVTSQRNFDIQFWSPAKMEEMWPQAFIAPTPSTPKTDLVADQPWRAAVNF